MQLADLPSPDIDLPVLLNLASEYPVQKRQLVKQFVSIKVQFHAVNWQLGYRCGHIVLAEMEEEFCQCPECHKQYSKKRPLTCIVKGFTGNDL